MQPQRNKLPSRSHGWALDVLIAVQSLNKRSFTTEDTYVLESHLKKLHPRNRHIREKIRQQLQVLRDLNLLLHLERNHWRLP